MGHSEAWEDLHGSYRSSQVRSLGARGGKLGRLTYNDLKSIYREEFLQGPHTKEHISGFLREKYPEIIRNFGRESAGYIFNQLTEYLKGVIYRETHPIVHIQTLHREEALRLCWEHYLSHQDFLTPGENQD